MLVIAHRGLSAHFPENTLVAFEQAIACGADAIECDVHQLCFELQGELQDEFAIFHDYELFRLTGQAGKLHELKLSSFESIQIAGQHKIPTLKNVLKLAAGKVIINLELKAIEKPKALVDYICQCLQSVEDDAEVQIVISSFNHPLLQKVQAHCRDTRLAQARFAALIAHLPWDKAHFAIKLDTEIAAIDANLVDIAFVEHAHQYNKQVWCYTVNDAALLKKLYLMGVDGVFCDDAAWALEQVKSFRKC